MKVCAAALVFLTASLAASLGAVDRAKTIGNPNAPVKMEVFSDFECPACKNFHEQLLPVIMRDYVTPGKVYIVMHEFPLPMHQYSREAANYATAAARIGKYREVADALFRTQATWSINGRVWDTVASVLTPTEQKRVQELAKDPSVMNEVQQDIQAGLADKVNQTPTVVIVKGTKRWPWGGPDFNTYPLMRSLINGLVK
jgi:protein-disulfide isomerase